MFYQFFVKKEGEILGKCIEVLTYVQLNKMEEKYVLFHFLTKENEIPFYILYHIPAREVNSLNVCVYLCVQICFGIYSPLA